MADKKISQLPAATTPLVGTEVLPIVQSGVTDQVSIANITAGRVPAMNNAAMGYTAVTAAAGTTTLTASSNHIQKLTGSTTQTFKLPDATTITAGTAFLFDNDSTGLLTVVDNASGAVTTVASGSTQYVFLETAGTAAGSWGKYAWIGGAGALSVTAAKTASITNSLTLSGTDSTTMTFPSTSATVARTDAAQTFTGNQTISAGNIVIGTSGKGVDFTASKTASATGNILAYYEEGTWTPAFTGLTVTGTPTYSGTYTRVGNRVTITAYVSATTSTVSAAGGTYINNLPFQVNGGSTAIVSMATGDGLGTGYVRTNTVYIYTPTWNSAANITVNVTATYTV